MRHSAHAGIGLATAVMPILAASAVLGMTPHERANNAGFATTAEISAQLDAYDPENLAKISAMPVDHAVRMIGTSIGTITAAAMATNVLITANILVHQANRASLNAATIGHLTSFVQVPSSADPHVVEALAQLASKIAEVHAESRMTNVVDMIQGGDPLFRELEVAVAAAQERNRATGGGTGSGIVQVADVTSHAGAARHHLGAFMATGLGEMLATSMRWFKSAFLAPDIATKRVRLA